MADKYELESVKAFVETLQVSRLKVLGNHNNWSLGRLLPVCVMGGETIPYSTLIYFLCTFVFQTKFAGAPLQLEDAIERIRKLNTPSITRGKVQLMTVATTTSKGSIGRWSSPVLYGHVKLEIHDIL